MNKQVEKIMIAVCGYTYDENYLKELVERATPKKIEKTNNECVFSGKCPKCGDLKFKELGKQNFCSNCGQALREIK